MIQRMTRARLFIPALAFVTFGGTTALAQHWPHWRGPTHDGVSLETNLPVSWGAECKPESPAAAPAAGRPSDEGAAPQTPDAPPQGRGRGRGQPAEGRPLTSIACKDFDTKNVAWKLPLPAYSGSTPIIWGNTIFLNVATAANTGSIELWAIDRNKPAVKWKRLLVAANHIERKQNMSSPSPVTDGKHVWVMTGFGVFKAFDFDGKEIWSRDLQADYGKFGLNWGYASSPLLRPDGAVRAGAARDEDGRPVVRPQDRQDDGQDAVARRKADAGCPRISGLLHDAGVGRGQRPRGADHHRRRRRVRPRSGDGQGVLARRRPQSDERVRLPDRRVPDDRRRPDHRADAQQPARRHASGGSGDVAATHVAWTFAQGPDVPTPVSDGKLLYVVRDGGVVFALDVKTGETVYGPVRLPPGTYSASPILADGKIYVTTEEEGLTTVFRAGPKFEILSSNALLGDCSPYCLSTVAISEGQLFIRSSSYLWAIGERQGKK